MNLIIDAGNSAIKLAFFEAGALVLTKHVDPIYQNFKVIHAEYPQISSVLICDVRGLDWGFLSNIFESKIIFKLSSSWRFPFQSEYKTPKMLGTDRVGLVAAASKMYPNQNVLIVDIGSCITFRHSKNRTIPT